MRYKSHKVSAVIFNYRMPNYAKMQSGMKELILQLRCTMKYNFNCQITRQMNLGIRRNKFVQHKIATNSNDHAVRLNKAI